MPEERKQLLWVDDEIEMLRSHIVYLKERGYDVAQATNGADALQMARAVAYDLALVDEMMPVMDGLEVIRRLKEARPDLPVVMVTKNEAEELMEQAIGSQIDGYLTKPVNPSQILSVLKGILERRKISEAQLTRRWAEEFAAISRTLDRGLDADGWLELHRKLSGWELELDQWGDPSLQGMMMDVRREADREFAKWVELNYPQWISASPGERPPLSMDVADKWLVPLLKEKSAPTLFLVIDCLRYDQWLTLEPLLSDAFEIRREGYFAALPSATPYARNAIFSGLTAAELERVHPDLWSRGDEDESSVNRFERQLLAALLERRGIKLQPEMKYVKVLEAEEAAEFEKKVNEYLRAPLTAMVYNFVDIVLHTRQSSAVLKEMIPDEAGFRAIVRAWFQHSSLYRILLAFAKAGGRVVVTSDHGSVRGRRGSQVVGDKETSSSLRYKYGRNLKCDEKHAVRIKAPEKWGLPARGMNTEYIIAKEDYFFLYPNNYHKYLTMFRDSFQHGGISMEEMILSIAVMVGKG